MSTNLPTINPTGYLGVNPTYPGQIWFRRVDPIDAKDVHNYNPGDTWINTATNTIWMLIKIVNQAPPLTKLATWVNVSAGTQINSLRVDTGAIINPVGGICNIYGDPGQGTATLGVTPSVFVTVDDATTASKGVAKFDPTYFAVAAGNVTLIASPGTFFWSTTLGPQILTPNHGWMASNAIGTVFTLPAVSAVGDAVAVQGQGAGGWIIQQLAGQQIIYNSANFTTPGIAGSVSSNDAYDSIYMVCFTANLLWLAVNSKGNLTFV